MIEREARGELELLARQFKAVAVVGPRQSGKTTLVRAVFTKKPYVTMEDPDTRLFATEDPRGFLAQYPDGAVLDEAQRVPHLFSYLQGILDNSPDYGRFILTGSNHFLLQENISQSLAGRIAYLHLLPLTLNELPIGSIEAVDPWVLQGGYPSLYATDVDPDRWFANYIRTYVERDVRQIKNIVDLQAFERFLRLCAGRTGQLLNMSNLAVEVGMDSKTIAAWLAVLESSFITFRLRPYHRNFNKRIVKMPKLYFHDTGLACALLGIRDVQDLALSPFRGALFENAIVADIQKRLWHQGRTVELFFWRSSTGQEVDLLIEEHGRATPVEIKSGQTVRPEFLSALEYWMELSGTDHGWLIHGGEQEQRRSSGITVVPWQRPYEVIARP